MSPGACVGEIALVDGENRSADVVAGQDSACHVLSREQFTRLETERPAVHAHILRNILLMNLERMRRGSTFADRSD